MAGINAAELMEKIISAKKQFIQNNKKEPDYVVISQNLYFTLCRAYCHPDRDEEHYFTKICGLDIKLISDSDFIMVGRNEILKLKGEQDVED